ncbi:TRAP transporter small permease [Bacillus alveayuensis]|jgi:TRAP-type transport system small permease protein|uniref:TRAP transporter small permease n=1 Tax=Aeribacillus alveayuensis TaxID=279215 RepID=UPI0005CD486F|nr:TRAP transporter small permease [Bacillus alveayuensis]
MKILITISDWIDRICRILITILLTMMTIILFIQVLGRYITQSGLPWTEELAKYGMIWMVFIGAAVATKDASHIKVSLIEEKFPSSSKWLTPIQNLISLVFLAIIAKFGWDALSILSGQQSANLRFPMSIFYFVIPLASAIMILHLLVQFKKKTERKEE